MPSRSSLAPLTCCGAAALLAGGLACASTTAVTASQYRGSLPRPERILVHPFATSADDVKLDHSVTGSAAWRLQGASQGSERRQVARNVSDTLAKHLVEKIQALGLPAQLADGPPRDDGRSTLVIDGQIVSVDEGNRTERVVIGLGAGRTDVRTAVQVYEVIDGGRRLVDVFEVEAKSGAKPGMAETMGAGGAAGNLGQAAVIGAAGSVASETFGDDVDADARRTAAKVATMLEAFFAREGWIAGPP